MLSKNLNKNQLEAVNHSTGPLLIVAGAGSGKTKTLTSRIIKLIENGINPRKILAITFTNKAAGEMRKRITSDNIYVGTFHSFGAKILREEAESAGRTAHFSIYDDNDSESLLKKIIKNYNLPKDKQKPAKFGYLISKAKSELVPIEDELANQIFNDYEKSLKNQNAFDFDDLIEKPVRIFQNNPALLKKHQSRYQHILVDEFQDTNIAQYLLIKLLSKAHGNISVVGDDAQSIYGWRHADFRNFLNFDKDWPRVKVILLEENYRSTGNIIEPANYLIKNNLQQRPKNLWTNNPAGEKIKVLAAEAEEDEANWVADKILGSKLLKFDETAVLYRTNAQSRAIEQALIWTRIPYRIFGGLKFYERKEIKDILAGLRLAANPKDEVSLDRLKKNFSKKIGAHLIEELPRLAEKLKTEQLINFIINNTNYTDYLEKNFKNSDERAENIQELIRFASSATNLNHFLEEISLTQAQDNPKEKDSERGAVNLMTIHLSKGLEFDDVFLIGCTESILPHQRSLATKEELEEERRLMYVAMTRARKKLFLTLHHLPSRFLYELPPELLEFEGLSPHFKEDLPDEEERWIEYN